jgi:anaphase-promoting complex subunit 6
VSNPNCALCLLNLTGYPLDADDDAFWLAQVHFSHGSYTRAQVLLSKQDLISRNASCRYLAAHCLIKQSRFEEALGMLGERNPTHLMQKNATKRKAQARPAKSGAKSSARDDGPSDEETANRRYEAAMCYLRGICFAKQNAFDRAKECYKDAVRIDVLCFEAFNQLMKNSLMSPDEEEEFLQQLDFESIKTVGDDVEVTEQEPSEYVQMLYQTRLSKFRNPRAFNTAVETLSTHYGLAENADLLLARADLFYTQCRFRDSLAITSSILDNDKYNFSVYPLHTWPVYSSLR